jgi:hypothetical protein
MQRQQLPKRHLHFLRRYYRRLFQALGGQPAVRALPQGPPETHGRGQSCTRHSHMRCMRVQADKYRMQKTQWNDEPSSRFINHYLTGMVHVRACVWCRVRCGITNGWSAAIPDLSYRACIASIHGIQDLVQEPVLHPGLALSIWILKGTLTTSPTFHSLALAVSHDPPRHTPFATHTHTTTTTGHGFPLHRDSVPPFDLTLDFVLDHVGPQVRRLFLSKREREEQCGSSRSGF